MSELAENAANQLSPLRRQGPRVCETALSDMAAPIRILHNMLDLFIVVYITVN